MKIFRIERNEVIYMKYMDISSRRKEYNISQTKLAVYSGFSKSLISSWERKIQEPSEEQLVLLKRVIEDLSQKVINGDPNIIKKKVRHSGEKKGKLPAIIKSKKEYDLNKSNMQYTSKYAQELSNLYSEAEKRKKKDSLKGIALFSGCGVCVNICLRMYLWQSLRLCFWNASLEATI